MFLTKLVLFAFIACSLAIHVTSPSEGTHWEIKEDHTISWSYVPTDKTFVGVYLTNYFKFPSLNKLIAKVNTTEGSVTVSTNDWPTGGGFRINLGNPESAEEIYAQSDEFTLLPPSDSASASLSFGFSASLSISASISESTSTGATTSHKTSHSKGGHSTLTSWSHGASSSFPISSKPIASASTVSTPYQNLSNCSKEEGNSSNSTSSTTAAQSTAAESGSSSLRGLLGTSLVGIIGGAIFFMII
ncbi:uncharacterized protein SOCG_03742 [Schizosaccharomyces octosporus yFS286]|uniref:Yeast cell wall synthesis Kre9/Knh1-like N-terminal domain-containing protein n=1 Tax=Schizosaccharomyces octosporus (strain yFS286) TaxID=483514 RepID=S9PRJ1_SCHOY|nr:uncharacterized protein SOCG_03742 [Schizosaccharomyces octosporus yFS286]EPX71806.1 hypothetical protein SOCG_03742 [Schizosaccharomyces octosporus yFS286]